MPVINRYKLRQKDIDFGEKTVLETLQRLAKQPGRL